MPFRTLVGHRALAALLSRAVSRDTLPPSLIFAGPEGIGKRRTALALAQALNCQAPVGDADGGVDACGSCTACTRIARGVHADILVVEPEESGSIKIHQVRDVVERTAFRPFEGRRRVIIFDEAEALVPQAQNALLKTLEEPPPSSVLVLVTARPDALLATVRSRCPRLRFGRLSPADVAEVLQREGASPADAVKLAAMADGSPGRALRRKSGQLTEARDAAARLLTGLAPRPDPKRRLKEAESFLGKAPAREGPRAFLTLRLEALSTLLRDVQLLASDGDARLVANADLVPQVGTLARAFDNDRLGRAFASVARAVEALDRNASPKVVADWIALQI